MIDRYEHIDVKSLMSGDLIKLLHVDDQAQLQQEWRDAQVLPPSDPRYAAIKRAIIATIMAAKEAATSESALSPGRLIGRENRRTRDGGEAVYDIYANGVEVLVQKFPPAEVAEREAQLKAGTAKAGETTSPTVAQLIEQGKAGGAVDWAAFAALDPASRVQVWTSLPKAVQVAALRIESEELLRQAGR